MSNVLRNQRRLRTLFLSLPLELRHDIYDQLISFDKLEGILVPPKDESSLAPLKMTVNPLFLVNHQVHSEVTAHIYSKTLHINGFPLFETTSETPKTLPISIAVLERLRRVEIDVQLSRDPKCLLLPYYSLYHSVHAIMELSELWAKRCQLLYLKVTIPTSLWISGLDDLLLKILLNFSLLRGLLHTELDGPSLFASELANATVKVMKLPRTESNT
ncbi:hypothetical protein K469DRAFT_705231 [Zopfia rhizophila CBS 207.26]|uniref:F-box domain-containing protein n=1 Tax=Zopfia rhizophila CBS 207.26 TaxID=1314779 RepID=A0A6A6D918_9PEZI|nr:hypothetical protein K469DRAFT_705231 [Zopfia rhizophila CBS 207.26]